MFANCQEYYIEIKYNKEIRLNLKLSSSLMSLNPLLTLDQTMSNGVQNN